MPRCAWAAKPNPTPHAHDSEVTHCRYPSAHAPITPLWDLAPSALRVQVVYGAGVYTKAAQTWAHQRSGGVPWVAAARMRLDPASVGWIVLMAQSTVSRKDGDQQPVTGLQSASRCKGSTRFNSRWQGRDITAVPKARCGCHTPTKPSPACCPHCLPHMMHAWVHSRRSL